MRKIIGFKLPLRAAEIKRRAKKAKLDLGALGLEQEALLQKKLDAVAAGLAPGVLFETFKHPDPDAEALSPIPGLAYSLILATLGEAFAELEEPFRSLIREAALDETIRFAASLLSDEAAKDVCELSPINALGGAEVLQSVLRKLEGSKVGVSLQDGALKPAASAAVSLSWLSKSKAKGKSK